MSKKKVYCKNCKFGDKFGGGIIDICSKITMPNKYNKYTGILESLSVHCYPKEENSNGECVYYEEKG